MKIFDIKIPQVGENYIMRADDQVSISQIVDSLMDHYISLGLLIDEMIIYHMQTGRFIGGDEELCLGECGIESGEELVVIWR